MSIYPAKPRPSRTAGLVQREENRQRALDRVENSVLTKQRPSARKRRGGTCQGFLQSEFDVAEEQAGASPVVIKKYANRRLYNTQTSSYVTLDHLALMVKEGTEFEVRDARTGDDITRSVLTQIIFEEEAKGQNLLPIQFLRRLIRFYGDSLQAFVPGYLDMTMESFTKNQEAMKGRIAEAFGGGSSALEAMTRQESGDVRARDEDVHAFRHARHQRRS